MRQLTVTIPDHFYESFINFFKHIPDVYIRENNENIMDEIPPWQQKMVLERMKNTKHEDYIDADETLKQAEMK